MLIVASSAEEATSIWKRKYKKSREEDFAPDTPYESYLKQGPTIVDDYGRICFLDGEGWHL